MRLVLFCFVLVLTAGCIHETADAQMSENISEEITEAPVLSVENMTITPEVIDEETEQANETNQTLNENPESNETLPQETNETVAEPEEIDGLFFGGGRYVLVLDDVAWYGDKSCAIVTIAYANATAIKKDVMCPRSDYYWTDSAGMRFRFKVIDVAAGYSGEAWADIIIYG